jgi:hypothetical protein
MQGLVEQKLLTMEKAQAVLLAVKNNLDIIYQQLSVDGAEGVLTEPEEGEVDFVEELDHAMETLQDDEEEEDDPLDDLEGEDLTALPPGE